MHKTGLRVCRTVPEIPAGVVREVLANSFAHAVYGGGTTHENCIHPGMITVYNPGEYGEGADES